jgi:predicted transcriptional regulator
MAEAPVDARISVAENPDEEHADGYFLNYRDARDILTYDDQRELLEHIHAHLTDTTST